MAGIAAALLILAAVAALPWLAALPLGLGLALLDEEGARRCGGGRRGGSTGWADASYAAASAG